MANVRIKDLTTTAATTASDDFFGVDGATNGTRKLNAYSPTFGGNLTVSGTALLHRNATPLLSVSNYDFSGDYSGASTVGALIGSNSTNASLRIAVLATDTTSDPFVNFLTAGATNWSVGVDNSDSDSFKIANTTGVGSNEKFTLTTAGNATLSGNLTVSGGTITSGSGTLTLNSSANTVILQSAGTTALTLDSSQNATFAGNVTASGGTALFQATNANSIVHIKVNSDTYNPYIRLEGYNRNIYVGVKDAGAEGTFNISTAAALTSPMLSLDPATNGATFAGAIAIGNTVAAAAGVASTHKVTISIGGTTYYLLATNV